MQSDEFMALSSSCEAEITVKGSRFIGHAMAVETREQAEAAIADIAKCYYDASHNCFAYRIGHASDLVFRYSDDGEPAGTAGAPIHNVLAGKGISNIAVVITRYFGGTKLGKGGLVRAYGECTRQTLIVARVEKKYHYAKLQLNFDYSLTSDVRRILSKMGTVELASDYGAAVELIIQVRKSYRDSLIEQLIDATAAKITIKS
ncbi:YigZ family protein [candidate division KSB1 bacterium]|nr:YigZ family protein [candidate division KSB1 bacterium]